MEVICIFSPSLFLASLSLNPPPLAPTTTTKPAKEFNLLDNKQYCYKTWKTRGRGLPDKEKGMPGNSAGACQAHDGAG